MPACTTVSYSVARASNIAPSASWPMCGVPWLRSLFLAVSFIGGSFPVMHPDHPIGAGGTATFNFQQSEGLRPRVRERRDRTGAGPTSDQLPLIVSDT